jgi:hypothetical protein
MFPEETRLHLNELIESHGKITPSVLFDAFKKGLKDQVRCQEDEVCVEAAATREYDYYLEKEDKLKMHLFLMRQMLENGHDWQLILDIEFKMDSYFEKYAENDTAVGVLRLLLSGPHRVWLSQFNGQRRAERLIEDVFSHGSYLTYSVLFGDADLPEE